MAETQVLCAFGEHHVLRCDCDGEAQPSPALDVEALAAAIRANWYEIRPYGGKWVRPLDAAAAIAAAYAEEVKR